MTTSNYFVWSSFDPVTEDIVVYPEQQCLLLEAAFRAQQTHATLLVKPTHLDHGLVATVTFSPDGNHTQRTLSG